MFLSTRKRLSPLSSSEYHYLGLQMGTELVKPIL